MDWLQAKRQRDSEALIKDTREIMEQMKVVIAALVTHTDELEAEVANYRRKNDA